MNIKKHIPNAITCGNLFCGCLAIVCAFNGNLVWSAYLVGIAAVLDFFDGFAARLLKVGGEMGKQLDSLADMVTFGVVPGVVLFQMILRGLDLSKEGFDLIENHPWIIYSAFIISIFSAIRLAKFNIDTRQTDSFIGVPTPANTILICSIPLIVNWDVSFSFVEYNLPLNKFILNPYLLISLSLLMSYLLIAELPLFALKFKNFGWADNKIRYSFLIISVILLIVFQFIAIPFIIFLYIILSILNTVFNKYDQYK
ncbi:MAG: CDP-diacylglycerol--serine O-phosphatidyltransferase [Bacteroidetes bacterium RIFCSPLOWO2_12_FULL_35_15]|nr:MAG: CDP-diacylglycerol--serine O-phosphatidyltransferase [Bacteroidetes bacterium RIFCSPLOWO2_12_FULL_35_15]